MCPEDDVITMKYIDEKISYQLSLSLSQVENIKTEVSYHATHKQLPDTSVQSCSITLIRHESIAARDMAKHETK